MASYVIIWENNTFGHMKVKGHVWSGHASINIGEEFESMRFGFGRMNYVSWWPEDNPNDEPTKKDRKLAGLGELGDWLQRSREGSRNMHFPKDVSCECYLPDHVIRLESDEGREARMLAAWKEVCQKKGGSSFKYLRKNCSTIVSRVLHAGGYYGKKWSLNNNFVWTPADIRKLAASAGGEFMSWTDFLEVLDKNNIEPTDLKTGFPPEQVTQARSGAYCTTGAPCRFQQDKQKDNVKRHAKELD